MSSHSSGSTGVTYFANTYALLLLGIRWTTRFSQCALCNVPEHGQWQQSSTCAVGPHSMHWTASAIHKVLMGSIFFPFHNRQSCAFSDHPAKLPVLMRPLFGSAALSISILHPQGCHAPNWPSSALAQAARIPEVGYGNARPSHMQLHVTLGHYLGHACHTHKISSPELIKQRTEMNFSLVIFLLPITMCTI